MNNRDSIAAQVRRAKAKCSSECKSRPGKGRCDREAIPAVSEVMKLSKSARSRRRGHAKGRHPWIPRTDTRMVGSEMVKECRIADLRRQLLQIHFANGFVRVRICGSK